MVKKKNVLFINPVQLGYRAGYLHYSKYLARDKDIEVDFLCLDQGFSKFKVANVNVSYLKISENKVLRYLQWLIQVFRKIKIHSNKDTVIFMVYFKFCFIFPLLFPRKKIILDIRTGSILSNPILNRIQNKIFKLTSLCFKSTTILSLDLLKYLSLKESRCSYLPLGAEVLSKKGKTFEKFKLIYVGAFDGRRVHETVEGIYLFLQKHTSVKLTYDVFGFGSSQEIQKFLLEIEKFNLEKVVKFHGRKTHDELEYYFNNCNIGVSYIPITKYFNFQPPTKTFEYVLSGLACVATSTHENKKLINSTNGVLCDDNPASFAHALEVMLNKTHNLNSYSIRSSLKDHSWENIVTSYLEPILFKSF